MAIIKRLAWRVGALVVATVIGGNVWARSASRPTNLGVTDGQLAPCPPYPNCVATQGADATQTMAPWRYTGPMSAEKARLLQVLQQTPRTIILADQDNYVAAVFRTAVLGFPDDGEFLFDDAQKIIHFRSASRLGRGDLNVNRKRIEALQKAFEAVR